MLGSAMIRLSNKFEEKKNGTQWRSICHLLKCATESRKRVENAAVDCSGDRTVPTGILRRECGGKDRPRSCGGWPVAGTASDRRPPPPSARPRLDR